MRVLALAARLRLAMAVVFVFALSGPVAAQDDEFDDEFEDEFEEEGADQASPPPAGDDDDEFEDDEEEFGDDDDDGEALPEDEEEPPGDDDDDDGEAAPTEALEDQLFRAQNTYYGPIGGIHVVDANSAKVGTFRVQLATQFFFASDFLVEGDSNDRIGGALSLSWTLHEYVEAFASIAAYANFNDHEDPQLFQTLGDTLLGVKVHTTVMPWLSLGGDLSFQFLNTVGDIGVVLDSTSFGLRGLATADLRQLDSPIPLIARLSMQYFFDNSSNLITDVEQRRYDALPPDMRAADPADESAHLVTRVERFALNINRTDFFNIGLGLEAPFKVASDLDLYLSPILEWSLGVPVNRQGYDCLFLPDPLGGEDDPAPGDDGCLDRQGISSFPQTLTLGLRVLPPLKGLAGFLSVDVGLTGTSTFVRELAGNAPYNVMLGLSYAYDPSAATEVVREVVQRVEVPAAEGPQGRINGVVVEQGPMTPVAAAVIRFPGRELTALSAGDDGRFISYQLPPGEVQLEVSHPDYNPGTCAGTIPEAGGDVEVRCELVALPRMGTVAGRVVSDAGAGVSATVNITGTASRTVQSDATGAFSLADLAPGVYTASVDAEGFLLKQQAFTVIAQQQTSVEITLVPRPAQALVTVSQRAIAIRRQINFATDSAEILASSDALMTEIADVLLRNPDILRVEIQGHTDNTGADQHNVELSQRRADSVMSWLTSHGVDASRLEARGYGPNSPLVPNITPANRARNRRVQFVIKERASSGTN